MSGARKDRSPMASEESTMRQIGAAQRWFGEDVKRSSYERWVRSRFRFWLPTAATIY